MQARVTNLEAELGNQKIQLGAALQKVDEANAAKAAAVNAKDRTDSSLKLLKRHVM